MVWEKEVDVGWWLVQVGGGFKEGFVVCSGLRFSIRKI
jgi:hypothetical protein